MSIDWLAFNNFTKKEFNCSHCGECHMNVEFIKVLQDIRDTLKKPMVISSGYRCENHPIEAVKTSPGEHTFGMACDILCYGEHATQILHCALNKGINRIGLYQQGKLSGRFIHLGIGDKLTNKFPSSIWTY